MFCSHCGNEIDDEAVVCVKCGVAVKGRMAATANVPNHMVGAVILAFFCLVPGVVAIVYASKVNSRLAAGDYDGALKASRCAKGWVTGGTIVCAIFIVFGLIMGAIDNTNQYLEDARARESISQEY